MFDLNYNLDLMIKINIAFKNLAKVKYERAIYQKDNFIGAFCFRMFL